MKEIKQIFKMMLLLLVLIAGSSNNPLFAKSDVYNDNCAVYISSDNSPKSVPFIFQPIEDFQSEDDDHISIENNFYNFNINSIDFINVEVSSILVLNQSVIELRLWCINNNFRL